ncbi:hypothetical protein AX769_10230 [Frondihabitans sp. PAMC 28766]|uniref:hypothetical protein n=1 Tax=Frondihabitans sp. PAMC 28766 TaxID=1795630 RepID=UPI00078B4CDB|nr:hypothetical protein [Frondihabitans sp. PAMC 28766]AMM20456.1 hypothetical protein AX769_10230 [Frondihabitans sp. PAMC 28766]
MMLTLVTALTTTVLALEEKAPTFAPPYFVAMIAAIVFAFLGFVTFSYKNVANRQAPGRVPVRHEEAIDEFGHAEEH